MLQKALEDLRGAVLDHVLWWKADDYRRVQPLPGLVLGWWLDRNVHRDLLLVHV